jgi:hypothetical protein
MRRVSGSFSIHNLPPRIDYAQQVVDYFNHESGGGKWIRA